MKKSFAVLSVLILLMLSGCSNSNELKFKGENESWYAEYVVQSYNNSIINNATYYVEYKKDLKQLASAKDVKISFKSSAGGSLNVNFFLPGSVPKQTYRSTGSNIGVEDKNETVVFTVNIDGVIQTIELKSSN